MIRSYIDAASPRIAKVIATSYRGSDKRRLEQVFTLKDGTTVSFDVMGCVEFGFTFSFRPVAHVNAGTSAATLIRTARDLLDAVPLNQDGKTWTQSLKKALRAAALDTKATRDDAGVSLTCGEIETCALTVPQPRILEISWTIAP